MPILTVYARLTAMALRWAHTSNDFFRGPGETRTLKPLPAFDLKSNVYTNFTTRP